MGRRREKRWSINGNMDEKIRSSVGGALMGTWTKGCRNKGKRVRCRDNGRREGIREKRSQNETDGHKH